MNFLNKFLNVILVFLITIIIFYLVFQFIEPVICNGNIKGKEEKKINTCYNIYRCVEKYIDLYNDEDIETLKKCNTKYNRKSDEKYKEVCGIVKQTYNFLEISKVEKFFGNVFIVEYSLNTDFDTHILDERKCNKLVLKLSNKRIKIFYDSLLDEN